MPPALIIDLKLIINDNNQDNQNQSSQSSFLHHRRSSSISTIPYLWISCQRLFDDDDGYLDNMGIAVFFNTN
jgi:hypothetical protein